MGCLKMVTVLMARLVQPPPVRARLAFWSARWPVRLAYAADAVAQIQDSPCLDSSPRTTVWVPLVWHGAVACYR